MKKRTKTMIAVAALSAAMPQAAWSFPTPVLPAPPVGSVNDTCGGIPRPSNAALGQNAFWNCINGKWVYDIHVPDGGGSITIGGSIPINGEYDWELNQ